MPSDPSENIPRAGETALLRGLSDMLILSALCGGRACRRARACRGEPRDCLARYAPLVPEDAREGAKAMIEGRALGWSFDELLEDSPDEVAAIADWIAAAKRSRRDGAGRRRLGPPRR